MIINNNGSTQSNYISANLKEEIRKKVLKSHINALITSISIEINRR